MQMRNSGARNSAAQGSQPRDAVTRDPVGPDSATRHPVAPGAGGRNARIGSLGEQAAARYLVERGYRLLDRNWRSADREQRGELDLVLRRRGVLVVCEVKSRTGERLAHPSEAVTDEKTARLRRLAALWVREQAHRRAERAGPWNGRRPSPFVPTALRIDVVAVRLGPREPFPLLSIEHLEGVA